MLEVVDLTRRGELILAGRIAVARQQGNSDIFLAQHLLGGVVVHLDSELVGDVEARRRHRVVTDHHVDAAVGLDRAFRVHDAVLPRRGAQH